ncbi:hypothetical protein AURDEDRAFT_122403 [Auricularia subglabra TFB-10046 SS5]|nr:hypothetical protein AURDEDRAFT_122403 [Auricularia subglabra TFB-10046 SS5]
MAPVQSTLTKPIRDAYEDVVKHANNLLRCITGDLSRFRFVCPEFGDGTGAEPRPNPRGTVRGVWRKDSGRRLIIPLIGVIDYANSKIGSYGNLDKSSDPTFKKLKSCKFIVALRFPPFDADHPDVAYAEGVINQMARLADMQRIVNTRAAEATRYNNAMRFSDNNGDLSGCIVTTLGLVYTPVSKEATAEEFLRRSPTKVKPPSAAEAVPNIVDDPKYYTQCVEGGRNLKHNDQLPIYFLDGARVGRTGDDLTRELTDGRWVRADCELIVWNMTDDSGTVRTFQLAVDKMVVLPRLPTKSILEGGKGLEGPGLSYAPMTKEEILAGGSGKGKEQLEAKPVSEGSVKTLSSDGDTEDDEKDGAAAQNNGKRARDATEAERDGKKAKRSWRPHQLRPVGKPCPAQTAGLTWSCAPQNSETVLCCTSVTARYSVDSALVSLCAPSLLLSRFFHNPGAASGMLQACEALLSGYSVRAFLHAFDRDALDCEILVARAQCGDVVSHLLQEGYSMAAGAGDLVHSWRLFHGAATDSRLFIGGPGGNRMVLVVVASYTPIQLMVQSLFVRNMQAFDGVRFFDLYPGLGLHGPDGSTPDSPMEAIALQDVPRFVHRRDGAGLAEVNLGQAIVAVQRAVGDTLCLVLPYSQLPRAIAMNTWEIRIRTAHGRGFHVIVDAEVLTSRPLSRTYIAAPHWDTELDVALSCFQNNERYQGIQIPCLRLFRLQEVFVVSTATADQE